MTSPALPPDARPIVDPDDPRAPIPGHAVRADGVAFYWDHRRNRWIPLRRKTGPGGFVKVRIRIGERVRELGLARLVLRAFEGPCPLGCTVLHYPDTDPSNCRLENLRWAPEGTSKIGRLTSGSPPKPRRGTEHYHAVLDPARVVEIRAQYRAGWRYHEIAQDLGVDPETVRHVLIGETWSHVPDDGPPIVMRRGPDSDSAGNTRLDWDAVDAIREGRLAGRTYASLAAEHGVDKCTVRDIVKGRTWRR